MQSVYWDRHHPDGDSLGTSGRCGPRSRTPDSERLCRAGRLGCPPVIEARELHHHPFWPATVLPLSTSGFGLKCSHSSSAVSAVLATMALGILEPKLKDEHVPGERKSRRDATGNH